MLYFDSHCHPQLDQYDGDREEVLARMEKEGVGGVVVGTDYKESADAVALAQTCNFLWASVGLHPNDNLEEELDISKYEALANDKKVVAIGECGLDYYRNEPTSEEKERQYARFVAHMELAIKLRKPLIIHCRSTKGTENANEEMIALLRERKNQPGGEHLSAIMHFFTSGPEIARQYLELGCYLSFPCVITFTNMYDESVRLAPADRILSETDAPFASPAIIRGKRNEPVYVQETVQKLAELRGVPVEDMAAQILANSKAVFGL